MEQPQLSPDPRNLIEDADPLLLRHLLTHLSNLDDSIRTYIEHSLEHVLPPKTLDPKMTETKSPVCHRNELSPISQGDSRPLVAKRHRRHESDQSSSTKDFLAKLERTNSANSSQKTYSESSERGIAIGKNPYLYSVTDILTKATPTLFDDIESSTRVQTSSEIAIPSDIDDFSELSDAPISTAATRGSSRFFVSDPVSSSLTDEDGDDEDLDSAVFDHMWPEDFPRWEDQIFGCKRGVFYDPDTGPVEKMPKSEDECGNASSIATGGIRIRKGKDETEMSVTHNENGMEAPEADSPTVDHLNEEEREVRHHQVNQEPTLELNVDNLNQIICSTRSMTAISSTTAQNHSSGGQLDPISRTLPIEDLEVKLKSPVVLTHLTAALDETEERRGENGNAHSPAPQSVNIAGGDA